MGTEGVKDGSERSPASAHLHHHRHTCSPLGACTTLQLGKERHSGMNTHTLAKTHFQNPQGGGLYTTALHPAQYRVQALQNFDCSPALLAQLGPQVPRFLQGPTGSTIRPLAASGQGSARLTSSPAALAGPRPPGSSYSALGAQLRTRGKEGQLGLSASGQGRPEWRVPGARCDLGPQAPASSFPEPGAAPSGPGHGRSGLAAPREALRRVQLHRLPPPHLALLPVGVRL